MKRLAVILGMVLGLMGSAVSAAELESPADGTVVSGLGFISGWKCDAGSITVRLNEGGHIPLATEQPRADTRLACGTLTNGFITQVNWNFLGAGTHTAVAYDDGVEFARATFTVGTTGEEFLRGVEAECLAPDFPAPGETGVFVWNESTQHLELAEVGGADLLPPVEECEETACPVCEVCRECPSVESATPFDGEWTITLTVTEAPSEECALHESELITAGIRIENHRIRHANGLSWGTAGGWSYKTGYVSSDGLFSLMISPTGLTITRHPTTQALGAYSGRLSGGSGSGSWFTHLGCLGEWTAHRH